ncbi:NAD(P)/FAD-dependent oxidoreductase [Microvirga brassicacearum]|uniref:NADH:ubiquinone reductase (non-electrogenic) n=1 Tax=Microvirga brassicacearum TaxID=2580413 RepID=A0A5N3P7H0_9HYPH|nr:NAD(P)/FAD-dependent oxidoreductase [Microvirga brassicacearum]KAB0265601.1 NAD(P)/FAD-dependent oxidoreductase [Microvirga brassicacearum]
MTQRIPPPTPHIVIVGAGFAGLACAQQLGGSDVAVTLIDRRNYHLFAPLLYQVATAVLSPGEIAEPIRRVLSRHQNITVLLGEVEGVDTNARQVRVDGRAIPYDELVLATGATHSYFGHPEWERFAPGLKTLEDARRIRTQVLMAFERAEMEADPTERERLMTIAVIGGGPTGVEMAGAVAELARLALVKDFRHINPAEARVVLLEAAPRILLAFPEDLAVYAERALKRLGVTIRTGTPVEDISEQGVTLKDGFLPASVKIWGAGVEASPVGRWLGIETDRAGRVRVNPDLSVPGLEHVYVLGDVSLLDGPNGRPLPGLAQVADQQGRYLGQALLARLKGRKAPGPFRYRSRGNLAVVGRNSAVIDFDGTHLRGFPAWVLWGIVHIYLLVGFQNRFLVVMRWLWAYLTSSRGARIIAEEVAEERVEQRDSTG